MGRGPPIVEKVLLIILGWLLGLLSPAIVVAIKTRRENQLGRVAIRSELRDVAHKIALAAHAIHMRNGTVNRAHLEWLKASRGARRVWWPRGHEGTSSISTCSDR